MAETSITDEAIAATLADIALARGPDRSFCPSEAARRLARDDWRPLMPRIRAIAAKLAFSGQLRVTQKGRPIDALAARGPIRLSTGTVP